ncbi:hypothetical protein [Sediminimonas qiaohouensis]|uniref:hypothetical protein n=1 Tax=Sediminimonas qiaohouensis TaxID=552061 RepID=UPI0004003E62|nr:hypothetical protein [Sediminimonas qiaohouensis]
MIFVQTVKTIALAAGLSLMTTAAPAIAQTDGDMAVAMPTIERVRGQGYVVSRMIKNPREGHLKLVAYNETYERQLTLNNSGNLMLDQKRPLDIQPLLDRNGRVVVDQNGLPVPASEGVQVSSSSGSNSSSGSGGGSTGGGDTGSGGSGGGGSGGDNGSGDGDADGGGIGVGAGVSVGGIGVGVGVGID